jgi:two-component system OmpR family sensor kinase
MRWKWLSVFIPFALGLSIDILLNRLYPEVPIFYLRVDAGTLFLLAGFVFTALAASVLSVQGWFNSRQQALQAQLQTQSADERRRFLRRLDHELKNPLTAIRAGLANMSEAPSQEARKEALCSVEAQALRLSRLAADLRKLAELEIRPLERTPVDIGLVLNEAFSLAQDSPESEQRRLTLSLPQAPWPLPKISGDPDLLFLAVHNLLDNALKFTRSGDTVEVRSFEDGANVVVEVADTGPGIPGDELPHVWEELYRGQGARGIPGSGLGLALVRAIADRHNGQVSLRSRAGQGTVFTLKLPVGEAGR